jgi:hypothetical protein
MLIRLLRRFGNSNRHHRLALSVVGRIMVQRPEDSFPKVLKKKVWVEILDAVTREPLTAARVDWRTTGSNFNLSFLSDIDQSALPGTVRTYRIVLRSDDHQGTVLRQLTPTGLTSDWLEVQLGVGTCDLRQDIVSLPCRPVPQRTGWAVQTAEC